MSRTVLFALVVRYDGDEPAAQAYANERLKWLRRDLENDERVTVIADAADVSWSDDE